MPRLREIRRFPALAYVEIDARGLVGDRAYAVVDGDGKLATGKHPATASIRRSVRPWAPR